MWVDLGSTTTTSKTLIKKIATTGFLLWGIISACSRRDRTLPIRRQPNPGVSRAWPCLQRTVVSVPAGPTDHPVVCVFLCSPTSSTTSRSEIFKCFFLFISSKMIAYRVLPLLALCFSGWAATIEAAAQQPPVSRARVAKQQASAILNVIFLPPPLCLAKV